MLNILITGGGGFIGSHLADYIKQQGHTPIIFDRKQRPGTDILGDIKDREAVLEGINQTDAWINLAGLLGTAEMINVPQPAVDVNIHGALNCFDGARIYKKRGVQIAVGNWWMNNPYSLTKNTAERFALMYNKEHGTDIRVVRAMNVYGPKQKHRPVRKIFPNVVIPALLDQPITVYGDGSQIMDLIYVQDVCSILGRALLYDDVPNDLVYEAGCGGDYTINQLVADVVYITKTHSKINYVPMRPGEQEKAVVQATEEGLKNLEKFLGYTAGHFFARKDAYKQTIDWYCNHLKEFRWEG